MSRLTTPAESTLSAASLLATEPFRFNGKLAPVYLQIGNSEPALNAYLGMETALKKSTLALREVEAIKLLVSELNQCDYCLAIHQVKAGAAGLSDEQKLAIRRGEQLEDTRLNAITSTVRTFFSQPGPTSDEQFEALQRVGLTDAELVDMALVAATIFFTNVFNHLNKSALVGKPAPAI